MKNHLLLILGFCLTLLLGRAQNFSLDWVIANEPASNGGLPVKSVVHDQNGNVYILGFTGPGQDLSFGFQYTTVSEGVISPANLLEEGLTGR